MLINEKFMLNIKIAANDICRMIFRKHTALSVLVSKMFSPPLLPSDSLKGGQRAGKVPFRGFRGLTINFKQTCTLILFSAFSLAVFAQEKPPFYNYGSA